MEKGPILIKTPSRYVIRVLDRESSPHQETRRNEFPYGTIVNEVELVRGTTLTYGRSLKNPEPSLVISNPQFSRIQGKISLLEMDNWAFPGVILENIGRNNPTEVNFKRQDAEDNPKKREERLRAGDTTRVYPAESIEYLHRYLIEVSELPSFS